MFAETFRLSESMDVRLSTNTKSCSGAEKIADELGFPGGLGKISCAAATSNKRRLRPRDLPRYLVFRNQIHRHLVHCNPRATSDLIAHGYVMQLYGAIIML